MLKRPTQFLRGIGPDDPNHVDRESVSPEAPNGVALGIVAGGRTLSEGGSRSAWDVAGENS
jgi:hypothetical protein